MNILGKTTVHPVFFFTSKVCFFGTALLLILALLNIYVIGEPPVTFFKVLAYVLFAMGVVLSALSFINLGSAVRFGLPKEKTQFKSSGVYSFSRNPMYLGFGLILLSGVFLLWHVGVTLMVVYAAIVHHRIVLGEENFLKQRFGKQYVAYTKKVRRYF